MDLKRVKWIRQLSHVKPPKISVTVLFQLSCPPCVFSALPELNRLQQAFADRIQTVALATSFEDPEINTSEDNLRSLFQDGILSGAAELELELRACEDNQRDFTSLSLDPSAFSCIQNVGLDEFDSSSVGFNFTSFGADGTPLWILADESGALIKQWVGESRFAYERVEAALKHDIPPIQTKREDGHHN